MTVGRARVEYRGVPASGRRELRWRCLAHNDRMQVGPWLDASPESKAKAESGAARHDRINHPPKERT